MRFDFFWRFLITCSVIYLVPMVLFWSLDNKPPITMSRYTVTPAPPGGTLWVAADVKRDLTRDCSTVFTVQFIDAGGRPQSARPGTPRSSKAIEWREEKTPGKLFFPVHLDKDTMPGTGEIFVDLPYTCNPWHWGYPINVPLRMTAEVLEPLRMGTEVFEP